MKSPSALQRLEALITDPAYPAKEKRAVLRQLGRFARALRVSVREQEAREFIQSLNRKEAA